MKRFTAYLKTRPIGMISLIVLFLLYVLEASLMMTPLGRNMWLCAYKVVFDGYLFIPYLKP